MTISDFLALGFEVSRQEAFNEPFATEASYYNEMDFALQGNLAVRRRDVFAIRGALQHRETLQTSDAYQFLKLAGGLHINAGSVFIAAFSIETALESVTSGAIGSGPLSGCTVIAFPSGFLAGGSLFESGTIVPVTTSGKWER
jgi:hypothetical protein